MICNEIVRMCSWINNTNCRRRCYSFSQLYRQDVVSSLPYISILLNRTANLKAMSSDDGLGVATERMNKVERCRDVWWRGHCAAKVFQCAVFTGSLHDLNYECNGHTHAFIYTGWILTDYGL